MISSIKALIFMCLFQYQSFKNDNILMIQNEKYVTFLIEIFK